MSSSAKATRASRPAHTAGGPIMRGSSVPRHTLLLPALALLVGCGVDAARLDDGESSASVLSQRSVEPSGTANLLDTRRVDEVLARAERADVVISLVEADGHRRTATSSSRRDQIRALLDAFLADFGELRARRRLANVPVFAASVSPPDLDRLRRDPRVASIVLDMPIHPDLYEAVAAIRAKQVHKAMGFTGAGVTVAVLDTGVDGDHPDLEGKVLAEHCFTQGHCPPGNVDEGTDAMDTDGHGTGVAGIIASAGVFAGAGFAPGASLVAVRVIGPGVSADSDWLAGLDWVLTSSFDQPVRVVNMSFGSLALYDTVCDASGVGPTAVDLVNQLNAQGVVLFASSGNDASSTSVEMPACLTGVAAVGAVYDAAVGREPDEGTYHDLFPSMANCSDDVTNTDVVTCFTNSNAELDLVAPGGPILTDAPGSAFGLYWGTSQAAPAAAGVAALMLEANPLLTPQRVVEILKSTGTPVIDPKNGLTIPRVDALAAVRAAVCDGQVDGAPCDDGDVCTAPDACSGGVCSGKASLPDGAGCEDGSGCTTSVCAGGECTNTDSVQCAPSTACFFAMGCNPDAGLCYGFEYNGGMSCDDGDACIEGEKCESGKCEGDTQVGCPEPDECRVAVTCDPATGCPELPAVSDGTPCSIGACKAGVCTESSTGEGGGGGGGGGAGAAAGGPSHDDGKDDGGCGCRVVTPRTAGGAAWLFAGVAVLATARRRRTRI